ncbi:MAG TPA: hypothetical protein VGC81_12640 [Candidatus Methylomirabilis sp.]
MSSTTKVLIALAAAAMLLAVVAHFTGPLLSVQGVSFSRASANLSLLAIALTVANRGGAASG